MMRLFPLRNARTTAIAALFLFWTAWGFSSPSGVDRELLAMIPEGAEIVSALSRGQPMSLLVMTRSNTVDLSDSNP